MLSHSMRRALALLFVAVLLPAASAAYADLTLSVDHAGPVTITGVTDAESLPLGTSNAYTSKQGEHWTLNITSTETLETFVYEVRLPEGAAINYLSGKGARIATDGGAVVVKGSGEHAPFAVTVQYTIDADEANAFAWLPLVFFSVLLILLWFVLRGKRIRQKRERKKISSLISARGAPSYLEGIPARQQAMVKLLREAGGTLTQRQLELTLKLPKSSVSRNVEALRRRGIVQKAQLGMTNTVVLDERYH